MTRKRFVKLMMSDGWCRVVANDYAKTLAVRFLLDSKNCLLLREYVGIGRQ